MVLHLRIHINILRKKKVLAFIYLLILSWNQKDEILGLGWLSFPLRLFLGVDGLFLQAFRAVGAFVLPGV
jgi:hypothetical protein